MGFPTHTRHHQHPCMQPVPVRVRVCMRSCCCFTRPQRTCAARCASKQLSASGVGHTAYRSQQPCRQNHPTAAGLPGATSAAKRSGAQCPVVGVHVWSTWVKTGSNITCSNGRCHARVSGRQPHNHTPQRPTTTTAPASVHPGRQAGRRVATRRAARSQTHPHSNTHRP
jgi:hypothetical protein